MKRNCAFKRKSLGFSLLEILVAFGIIAIISALTIPIMMSKGTEKASAAKQQNTATDIQNLVEMSNATLGMPPRSMGPAKLIKGKLKNQKRYEVLALSSVPKRVRDVEYTDPTNPTGPKIKVVGNNEVHLVINAGGNDQVEVFGLDEDWNTGFAKDGVDSDLAVVTSTNSNDSLIINLPRNGKNIPAAVSKGSASDGNPILLIFNPVTENTVSALPTIPPTESILVIRTIDYLGAPLSGINITTNVPGKSGVTNSNGEVTFQKLYPGMMINFTATSTRTITKSATTPPLVQGLNTYTIQLDQPSVLTINVVDQGNTKITDATVKLSPNKNSTGIAGIPVNNAGVATFQPLIQGEEVTATASASSCSNASTDKIKLDAATKTGTIKLNCTASLLIGVVNHIGQPLTNAVIHNYAQVNGNAQYTISNLTPGSFTYTASAPYYPPKSKTVTLVKGFNVSTISLDPSPVCLLVHVWDTQTWHIPTATVYGPGGGPVDYNSGNKVLCNLTPLVPLNITAGAPNYNNTSFTYTPTLSPSQQYNVTLRYNGRVAAFSTWGTVGTRWQDNVIGHINSNTGLVRSIYQNVYNILNAYSPSWGSAVSNTQPLTFHLFDTAAREVRIAGSTEFLGGSTLDGSSMYYLISLFYNGWFLPHLLPLYNQTIAGMPSSSPLFAQSTGRDWFATFWILANWINNGYMPSYYFRDAYGNQYEVRIVFFCPVKVKLQPGDAKLNSDDKFLYSVSGFQNKNKLLMETMGGLNPDEAWLFTDRANNGIYRGQHILDGDDLFGDHMLTYETGYQDLERLYKHQLKTDENGKRYIPLEKRNWWEHFWLWLNRLFGFNKQFDASYDLKLVTRDHKIMDASKILKKVYVDSHTVKEVDMLQFNVIRQRADVEYLNGEKGQSADQWLNGNLIPGDDARAH